MARRARDRGERGDAGFSLVELTVALTILAVGVFAVIGVTNSSFRVAGGISGRSKGVGVATKVVEDMRAIPYDELNASAGTVSTSTTVVNGITYTIEQTVDWVADGTVTEAYKEGLVSVSWSDQTGSHEVHQSTYVYPGGMGPAVTTSSTSTTVVACTPQTPPLVVATPPTDVAQITTVVDLTWTPPSGACAVATYVIQYSTNGFATQNEVTRTATSSTYRLTGLSAGTTYGFRVAARSAAARQSHWSPIASLTTAVSTGSSCRLGTLTVSPTAINKRSASSGSGIESDLAVDLSTTGTCTGFYAVYRPTAATSRTATLTSSATGSYQGTLLGRTITWDVGRRYVDIHQTSDNQKVASALVVVCEHNVSRCS